MINIELIRYLGNLKLGSKIYYSVLMHDQHPILSIGAACKLLDKNIISDENLDQLSKLSHFRAVRDRLMPVLFESYPQDMVFAILKKQVDQNKFSADDLILARIHRDAEKIIECCCELFKATGEFKLIEDALGTVPKVPSIDIAIEISVINILINPENGVWALSLFDLLVTRGDENNLRKYLAILVEVNEYEALVSIMKIHLAISEGNQDIAESELKRLSSFDLPDPLQFQVNRLYARLFEDQGMYEEACEYFNKTNTWVRSESYREGAYLEFITPLNNLKFSPLPSESKEANHLIMLGFPRSGTTLLENILDSHPSICTLEEIGALAEPDTLIRMYLAKNPDTQVAPSELVSRMKKAYYEGVSMGKSVSAPKFIIDKLPIMSSRAPYLKNLFSNKRYIFSIRHPYDVVLSCYKQAFGTNLAMDCFTSFEESCHTYDFVMDLWFSNFNLDSEDVCYVKYDDICLNFEEEVTRVLNFIGVEWNPAVFDFSENAKMRSQRTPSYGKVKLGNTIGVQSSWKKYQFLFRKPQARVLDKWVSFFGYEGLSL